MGSKSGFSHQPEKSLPGSVEKDVSFGYRMVEHKETVKSKVLPDEKWDILVSYPELYGAIKEPVKTKINNAIVVLANEYKCPNNREYVFTSKVKYLDEHLLSLKYNMLWFCNGMSYDSTSDSVAWNLNTGDKVVLDSEFIDKKIRDGLYVQVASKIKKIMGSEDKKECPSVDRFSYFYKTKTSLFFVVQMEQRYYSWCNVEIKYPLAEMKKYLKPTSILLRE